MLWRGQEEWRGGRRGGEGGACRSGQQEQMGVSIAHNLRVMCDVLRIMTAWLVVA